MRPDADAPVDISGKGGPQPVLIALAVAAEVVACQRHGHIHIIEFLLVPELHPVVEVPVEEEGTRLLLVDVNEGMRRSAQVAGGEIGVRLHGRDGLPLIVIQQCIHIGGFMLP